MVKKQYKKRFKKEEEVVLTLDDLQGMRDRASKFEKENIQTQIDLHFMPPKPKRKKREKKKRIYRDRN